MSILCFGGKWGTEILDTKFPVPTLLFAGYSLNEAKKPTFRGVSIENI